MPTAALRPRAVRAAAAIAAVTAAACGDPTGVAARPDAAPSLARAPGGALTLSAPVFALGAAPDGSLFGGSAATGVFRLARGAATPFAPLTGVSGIAPIGAGEAFVLTGSGLGPPAPTDAKLFRVSEGRTRLIADLRAFEEAVNPDGAEVESNPYNLAVGRGNEVFVADAAGNSIVHVSPSGALDWMAVLPTQLVSTAPFKQAVGCQPGDAAGPCGLPPQLPAEAVATSVAVGRDGAIYAGELTGFPATPGAARVWRIAPGSRRVSCPSAACTLFATGFTSIVDLTVSPDGRTLWTVELDLASWLAIEGAGGGPAAGGRVRSCDLATGACTTRAAGLSLPTALTFAKDGTPWVATHSNLFGGTATVRPLF